MNKILGSLLIAVFLTGSGIIIRVDTAFSQDKKLEYELSERCGKRGEEIWRNEYVSKNSDSGNTVQNYVTHYNAPLNKCFFLEIRITTGKTGNTATYRLFDANENSEYAMYVPPFVCTVLDVRCKSETEWKNLVTTYLESARF